MALHFCKLNQIRLNLWCNLLSLGNVALMIYQLLPLSLYLTRLCQIFNLDFHKYAASVFFSFCLKTARITSTRKSGSETSVKKYQPVSSLYYMRKVFHNLCIHVQMIFFYKSTFFKWQYVFSGLSQQRLTWWKYTTPWIRVKHTVNLPYFSRPFDRVDHDCITRRLESWEVRG